MLKQFALKRLCFLLFLFPGFGVCADPGPFYAERMTVDGDPEYQSIQGLKWLKDKLLVEYESKAGTETYTAILEGSFKREEWHLLAETERLPSGQNFSYRVLLTEEVTQVQFVAVGPYGLIEKELVKIQFPHLAKKPVASPVESSGHVLPAPAFTAGLGLTHLTMTQTSKPDFSLEGLTLKASYRRALFIPRYDWSIVGFITALSLSKNPSDRSAAFAGFNFRVGYSIPISNPQWSATLALGGYWNTTWTNPSNFGYSNVYGPQVFPAVKKKISDVLTLGSYIKYSPVADQLSVLSLSSREFALGIEAEGFIIRKIPISYTLDFASLVLNLTSSKIRATSITVGASTTMDAVF